MAEETAPEATEPQGEEPDYKALYEAEKAHSRKWEKQAKANKGAADKLAALSEGGKSAEERIAELESRIDAADKAKARGEVAAKVAASKGVPAELLVGDTEEDMETWADKMLSAFRKSPAPKAGKPGKFDNAADAGDEKRGYLRELLGKQDGNQDD